jgi:hypothetical protein
LTNADRALLLIYDQAFMPGLHFYFRQMTVPNGLITFYPLCDSSFSGTLQISKSFKLTTFWLLDSAFRLRGLVKRKGPLFSQETDRHTVACYNYKAGAAEHVSSHRFSFMPSHLSCYFQSFPATHSGTSHYVLHG